MLESFHNSAKVATTSLLLFCLSLCLTAYSAKNPSVARIGSVVVSESFAPVASLYRGVHGSVRGLWEGYVNLVDVKSENETLKSRLVVLEAENARLREYRMENIRLSKLLGVSELTELKGVSAEVIGYDPSNWTQAIQINRGTRDGIHPGMPVLSGNNGIVGQVVSAGPTTSQVLLIIDHASGVDAVIQQSRVRGIAEGSGSKSLYWRYVLRDQEVQVGDVIVASGMDGVYPKGLLIGRVKHVDAEGYGLFHSIVVEPTVDFSRLETVLVVTDTNRVPIEEITDGKD